MGSVCGTPFFLNAQFLPIGFSLYTWFKVVKYNNAIASYFLFMIHILKNVDCKEEILVGTEIFIIKSSYQIKYLIISVRLHLA